MASHLSRLGLTEVSRAALPFVGVMLVYLALITYVPEISLGLVDLLYDTPAATLSPATDGASD